MREADFQAQMNRLAETFGKQAYGTERVRLIWGEVKNLSVEWFAIVVDDLIGSCRQAPLLPEFREAVSRERDRQAQRDKQVHAKDASDFWKSTYHPEEIRLVVQAIKARIDGHLSDQDWDAFSRGLAGTAGLIEPACDRCFDNGIFVCQSKDGSPGVWAFRCHCSKGCSDPRKHVPQFKQAHAESFTDGGSKR